MGWFQALVLGVVQGVTEFLPISSSGHLVLLSKVPGWVEQSLAFDTTLHLGTVTALILYFWKDLSEVMTAFFRELGAKGLKIATYDYKAKYLFFILLGCIPAGVLGLLFDSVLEEKFRSVQSVAMVMLLGTVVLWLAEKVSQKQTQSKSLTFLKSLFIGIFQSLALLPGFSRSGATISGGIFAGLSKEEAARFSFLLSIPIIALAGGYQLIKSPLLGTGDDLAVIIGFFSSFLTGLAVVHFFLNYLKKHGLQVFIIYRVLLVVSLLVFY